MATEIILQFDGPIARVRMSTENGVHVFSQETRRQLAATLDQLEADDNSQVVIFSSHGRTFCAGADVYELRSLDEQTAYTIAREGQELMSRIERLRPVTIAAIHAACAGGGCELSLACDLRFGAAGCRMGLPETSIGVIPGWGGTVRTARLFGPSVAKRIVLAAELWPAEAALGLGLLHEVFPDDEFQAAVEQEAARLLARGPIGLETSKRLLNSFVPGDIDEQLEQEAVAFAACYATGQPQEGVNAFLEKRAAKW